MKKRDAMSYWAYNVLPTLDEPQGQPNWPARRKSWRSYLDGLLADGAITEEQRNGWTNAS